jgi:hypothetical protein
MPTAREFRACDPLVFQKSVISAAEPIRGNGYLRAFVVFPAGTTCHPIDFDVLIIC